MDEEQTDKRKAGRLTVADLTALNADLLRQVRLEEALARRAEERRRAAREDDGFGEEPTMWRVASRANFM